VKIPARHLGQRGLQEVLVGVPPGADSLGEDVERVFGGGVDFDRRGGNS
jgi:hypothetical protein